MRETITKLVGVGLVCGFYLGAALSSALADRPASRRYHQAKPHAAQNAAPKTTTIGDIHISGYVRMTSTLDLSSAHLTGPNTLVDIPEKGTAAHVIIHADDITMTGSFNHAGQGHLDMHGNLRYNVTQKTPEGDRKLTGTAGQGTFRRETGKLVLSSGVQCELVDPRLDGPGTLHAGKVTVDTASAPYLYTLEGDNASNDLRFAPKPSVAKKSPDSQIGPVHVTRWETGMFQPGKIAKFDGTQVVADLQSRSGTPQGQLKGRHIQGDFAPTGEITRARANDEVHYHIVRPIARKAADGKVESGRQEITGTSNEALFEPAAGRFTLDGAIDATLVNTLSLAEPAQLLASRLVVIEPTVEKEKQTLRYELTGAPNHRRLAFTPRPAESAPATPGTADAATTPTFTLGSIVVTGFQTGILEPGQKVDVTSDGTQALLLDTSDPKTHSASHLETHHFTATLAETGGITEGRTEGPVTFHIQQPGRATEPKAVVGAPARSKVDAIQSLDGNAAGAVYKGGGKERTIALQGPFTAVVRDPEHLMGPGNVKGQKDDTLSLDLLTREFIFDTPNATMVLDFTPRPLPEPEKTTPNPKAGTRKK